MGFDLRKACRRFVEAREVGFDCHEEDTKPVHACKVGLAMEKRIIYLWLFG